MALLGLTATVLFIAGATGLIGYALGYGHGRQEALSEQWDGRYRRKTPEPARLRLVRNVFDQDGGDVA